MTCAARAKNLTRREPPLSLSLSLRRRREDREEVRASDEAPAGKDPAAPRRDVLDPRVGMPGVIDDHTLPRVEA